MPEKMDEYEIEDVVNSSELIANKARWVEEGRLLILCSLSRHIPQVVGRSARLI
jgi:hypothetical protein